jgi:hypothetical protein
MAQTPPIFHWVLMPSPIFRALNRLRRCAACRYLHAGFGRTIKAESREPAEQANRVAAVIQPIVPGSMSPTSPPNSATNPIGCSGAAKSSGKP